MQYSGFGWAEERLALSSMLEPQLPPRLAHTNPVSFEHEILHRQSNLDSVDTRIASFQSEIKRRQELRRLLASEVAACDGVLAPFREFPAELLAEIFVYVVGKSDWSGQEALKLCHVCRHWRQVAVATSTLWNRFPERVEEYEKHCSIPVQMVQFWLANSSRTPLEISISWPFLYNDCKTTSWDAVMGNLDRIMMLELIVADCEPTRCPSSGEMRIPSLALAQPGSAPLLRYLYATFPGDDPNEEQDEDNHYSAYAFHETHSWAISLIRVAPALQKLVWRGGLSRLHEVRSSLSSLIHLELDEIPVDAHKFIDVIRTTSLLEHCDVVFDPTQPYTRPGGVDIQLKNLTFFKFADIYPFGELLDALTTPKLQQLSIRSEFLWDQQSFTAFLQRSGCHLTHLTINTRNIRDDEVLGILCSKHIEQSLVSFDIQQFPGWIASDDVLEYLGTYSTLLWNAGLDPPLPNLVSLSLTIELGHQFERLLALLKARLPLAFESDQDPLPIIEPNGIRKVKTLHVTLLVARGRLTKTRCSPELFSLKNKLRRLPRVILSELNYDVWIALEVASQTTAPSSVA